MRTANKFLFFCFLSLVCLNHIHATVFNAIVDGDWDETTTWDKGSVPGSLDTVVIDGYWVTININTGDVTIKHLTLSNTDGDSQLKINGLVTLTVTDDLEATSENEDNGIEVRILNGAIVNIGGNVDFTRASDNNIDEMLLLTILDASRMNVNGDFTFDYKDAESAELSDEILLNNTAILDVAGNTYLYMRGGSQFKIEIRGSSQVFLRGDLNAQISGGNEMKIHNHGDLTIDGNFTMNSDVINKVLFLELVNDLSVTEVRGDISMSALSEGDVYINLKTTSNFYIGGDFLRPTNYGAFLMSEGSTITYNGTQSQEIAAANLVGSGTDAFDCTNVVLNNSSGFILEDTAYVTENLDLTNGKIMTSPNNILIVGDSATITGGSESAYIDGPMIKKGQSLGDKFVFPIGDESTYAPLEVSAISNSGSQYLAQYFGDPPPFGSNIASDVGTIDENQYWELSKTPGSDDVIVTLHWMDAEATSITDLNSLIVVGLNEDNIWENFGNGGTTGGTGSGVSGSISSTYGDPPPFGVEKFTIGSTETVSGVEVEFHEKTQVLSIYPNPVGETLHLKGEDTITDEGILEVFGINGQRIYAGQCVLENGRFQISKNAINVHIPGTYVVRFTNAERNHVLKFNKL